MKPAKLTFVVLFIFVLLSGCTVRVVIEEPPESATQEPAPTPTEPVRQPEYIEPTVLPEPTPIPLSCGSTSTIISLSVCYTVTGSPSTMRGKTTVSQNTREFCWMKLSG